MFYPNVPDAIPLLTTTGCSFCAVFLTSFFAWSLWNAAREGIRHLRRLHQIPCDRCQYFTGEYLLKCTVHPCKAFSEDAINCLDFARRTYNAPPSPHRVRHTAMSKVTE